MLPKRFVQKFPTVTYSLLEAEKCIVCELKNVFQQFYNPTHTNPVTPYRLLLLVWVCLPSKACCFSFFHTRSFFSEMPNTWPVMSSKTHMSFLLPRLTWFTENSMKRAKRKRLLTRFLVRFSSIVSISRFLPVICNRTWSAMSVAIYREQSTLCETFPWIYLHLKR